MTNPDDTTISAYDEARRLREILQNFNFNLKEVTVEVCYGIVTITMSPSETRNFNNQLALLQAKDIATALRSH